MVDEIVTRQELIDAKRDARDLGKAVNEKVIVSSRYGEDFKSLPMITAEAQDTINEWQDAINTITVNDGVPALAVSDASGKNQQEVNNELYVFRKPVIYASNLKTDDTDQISELNALAIEAASKRLELVLPRGVITISQEFIPPNNLRMVGIDSMGSSGSNSSGTTLKWGGDVGTDKAVVRASRSAIGTTPTDQVVNVNLSGFRIDAQGCDHGLYARYFTNESYAGDIVVEGSEVCGIDILQCWFASFGKLTSIRANNVGINIGNALSGETGDINVNGINFPYLRTHTAGNAKTYVRGDGQSNVGAGIIINSRACQYGMLQAELGYGIGLIDRSSSRSNTYNSIYLEQNERNHTTDTLKRSMLIPNSGSVTRNVTIQNIVLMANQQIINDSISPVSIIDGTPATTDTKCLGGVGAGFRLFGTAYQLTLALTNTEYRQQVSAVARQLLYVKDIDIRYTASLPNTEFFVPRQATNLTIVVIPRAETPIAGSLSLSIDDGVSFGVTIPVGTPATTSLYAVRATISRGFHTIKIVNGYAASTEFKADIYVLYGELPSGDIARTVNF